MEALGSTSTKPRRNPTTTRSRTTRSISRMRSRLSCASNSQRGIMLNGPFPSNAIQNNTISGNAGDGIDIPTTPSKTSSAEDHIGVADRIGNPALGTPPSASRSASSLNTIGDTDAGRETADREQRQRRAVIGICSGTGNGVLGNRFILERQCRDQSRDGCGGHGERLRGHRYGGEQPSELPGALERDALGRPLTLTGALPIPTPGSRTRTSASRPSSAALAIRRETARASSSSEARTSRLTNTVTNIAITLPTSATGTVTTVRGNSCTPRRVRVLALRDRRRRRRWRRRRQTGPTFTVNTAADHSDAGGCTTNDCSLREAIAAANALPNSDGPDQIVFGIPTGGTPHTILATSALPAVTDG